MAKPHIFATLTSAGVIGVALVAPALAQFGGIFGGDPSPPRPPANVPSRPSAPTANPDYPPYEPQFQRRPNDQRLPPGPPPMSSERLPPGPPPGRIQTEPLPPPPGSGLPPPPASASTPPQGAPPAAGQRPPAGQPRPPGQSAAVPPNNDEVIVEPPTAKLTNPTAVFSGLDKITGRIISFEVQSGETVRFGALEVTPRACYTRPPTETQLTDGFIEVDELTLQGELRRIFTGWMFVASPGLNAVEHPIYDVWLTGCKGAAVVAETTPEAPAPAPPPQRRQQQAPQQPRRAAQPAQPQPLPNVQQGFPSQTLPPPPFR